MIQSGQDEQITMNFSDYIFLLNDTLLYFALQCVDLPQFTKEQKNAQMTDDHHLKHTQHLKTTQTCK